MSALTQKQIAEALRELGLRAGDIVFVHSSLSSMGPVEGGADTVVDALLEVLGQEGTLVVPTFTFSLNHDNGPIFDPANDPSEMGQISEAARVRPDTLRSHHMMHSVSALGPHAAEITSHHGASAFAGDSPFWKVYELGGRIMLLGVPYLRSTFFHVIEQLVQVEYRGPRRLVEERIRDENGTERPLLTQKSTRLPNATENDFNKFGSLLEDRGLSSVQPVGNALARLFNARDAMETGLAEYRNDHLIFVMTGDSVTPLKDGVLVGEWDNEKTVLDPALMVPSGSS